MNDRNLETLKVWYALFTVLMDDQNTSAAYKLAKLRELRDRLAREAPELEQAIRN